jgi:ribosomal protein S15P/S13E
MDGGDLPILIKVVKVDQTRKVEISKRNLQEISKRRRELGEYVGTKYSR